MVCITAEPQEEVDKSASSAEQEKELQIAKIHKLLYMVVTSHKAPLHTIIESIDSISRDGPDITYNNVMHYVNRARYHVLRVILHHRYTAKLSSTY